MFLKAKKVILYACFFLSFAILVACDDKTIDTSCTVHYQDKDGIITEKIEQRDLSFWSNDTFRVEGFSFSGLYSDENYRGAVDYDYCSDGSDIYVKQDLRMFNLDAVLLLKADVTVDKVFYQDNSVSYTTVDGRVFNSYYLKSIEDYIFIDMTAYLGLSQNEKVIDMVYSMGHHFYLTNKKRVLNNIHPLLLNEEESLGSSINHFDDNMFEDSHIIKMVKDGDNMFFMTDEEEIILITTDGENLIEVPGFTESVGSILGQKDILDIYYTDSGNNHIIIEDSANNLYQLHMDKTSIVEVTPYDSLSPVDKNDIIEELNTYNNDIVVSDNQIYKMWSLSNFELIELPDGLLNESETISSFHSVLSSYYVLSDENLYYFEFKYSSESQMNDFVLIDDEEYLNILEYIPLEIDEKIIDIVVEYDVVSSYELYIFTDAGRVLVSDLLNIDQTRPYQGMVFHDLAQMYELDTDDYFISMNGRYNKTSFVTNKGLIIKRGSINNITSSQTPYKAEHYENIIYPYTISIQSTDFDVFTDISSIPLTKDSNQTVLNIYKDPFYETVYEDYSIFGNQNIVVYILVEAVN